MNANERRDRILNLINTNYDVSFAAIRALLPDVSEMTIRRDLDYLSKANKIVRVFGGAKSIEALMITSEAAYTKRSILQADDKLIIAQKALELLKPDSTIFLGSGTTAYQFASLIPNGPYYIITTGLNCATKLSALDNVSIIMLGGSVNKNSYCVNGTIAVKLVDDMNFNIAFLGVSGYSPGKGFSTSVAEDYLLRQKIVERSECTVILMDSSKVGAKGIYTFATPDEIDYVISDGKLPKHIVDELTEYNITVL